ncbi:MAG: response regulator transcription factor [Oceanibaculum nanhaiense]|jgi:two-component system OmpR family response regulator|uniref:response regulator transcription factor n=1 Tax=Oceanibaculum nanhaiense TaxID=1909734 RepID=UPI0032ECDB84
MTYILVVEDEPPLRADLVDYLTICGYIAVGVGSAGSFEREFAAREPDVLILDIGLPDGNGLDLARQARARSDCGILMLTAHSESEMRIEGLDSGADAYLVKHTSLSEIAATVRSLLRRLDRSGHSGSNEHNWRFDPSDWLLIAPNETSVPLTATEVTFMTALIAAKGNICPRDTLLQAVSRPGAPANERNLDAIVRRLRRKVESTTGSKAPIRMVYGRGYLFTARPDETEQD